MSEPVRYAVVGLGRAGGIFMCISFAGGADAKIVAVVDPVAERREQAAAEFGCQTYTALSKMLKQEDAEVVIVASPSNRHGPDSKAALLAGKHVVVEKPMAMSLGEADSMIARSRETKQKLFVHQNYRFDERVFVDEGSDRQREDRAGVSRSEITFRTLPGGMTGRRWRRTAAGVLNNTCVHFIDQILQLLPGKVTAAMGDLQQIASAGDVEDHVKALRADGCGGDGGPRDLVAQNIAKALPKWIVCGTTGTLTGDGKNYTLRAV